MEPELGVLPDVRGEVKHLAKQVKQIVDPKLDPARRDLETGEPVGCTICLPDANESMVKVRSGRLLPVGWYHLLTGIEEADQAGCARWASSPSQQARALGPLLYSELSTTAWPCPTIGDGEASWILATNDLMNSADRGHGRHPLPDLADVSQRPA